MLIVDSRRNAEKRSNALTKSLLRSAQVLQEALPQRFWVALLGLTGPLHVADGLHAPHIQRVSMLDRNRRASSDLAVSSGSVSGSPPQESPLFDKLRTLHMTPGGTSQKNELTGREVATMTDDLRAELQTEAFKWTEEFGAHLPVQDLSQEGDIICSCAKIADYLLNATLGLPIVQHVPRVLPDRRSIIAVALQAVAFALAEPAFASYALYSASLDDYQDRKATGFKPVDTSDKATLEQIRRDIEKKRGTSNKPRKKPPQYCAGERSVVQPQFENICERIGPSKADQTNSISDDFGNQLPRR